MRVSAGNGFPFTPVRLRSGLTLSYVQVVKITKNGFQGPGVSLPCKQAAHLLLFYIRGRFLISNCLDTILEASTARFSTFNTTTSREEILEYSNNNYYNNPTSLHRHSSTLSLSPQHPPTTTYIKQVSVPPHSLVFRVQQPTHHHTHTPPKALDRPTLHRK